MKLTQNEEKTAGQASTPATGWASLVIVMIALFVIGCNDSATELHFSVMPPELSECKIYLLYRNGFSFTIARCPNSTTTTTYRSGKNTTSTILVDTVG